MDWVTHTVSAFGQSVGIPDLALDAAGCALFALDAGGTLSVHDLAPAGGDDVLVVLAQPLPMPAEAGMRRALRMADYRESPLWTMQVALRGEELVATLRMPRPAFVLSALEEAVEALFAFHTRVAQLH
jgi:type III secretion system chaperone SycN